MQRTKIEAQRLKDFKVNNYLFQSIDCTILKIIFYKKTSNDIWDSKGKKYQRPTTSKRR